MNKLFLFSCGKDSKRWKTFWKVWKLIPFPYETFFFFFSSFSLFLIILFPNFTKLLFLENKEDLEKESTKSISAMISKLTSLSKRKRIKNNPVAYQEALNYIQEVKKERLVLSKMRFNHKL